MEFLEENVKLNFAHIIALNNTLKSIIESKMTPSIAYLLKKNIVNIEKEIESINATRDQFIKIDVDVSEEEAEAKRNSLFIDYINNTETFLNVYKIKMQDFLNEKNIQLSIYELKVLEPLLNDNH